MVERQDMDSCLVYGGQQMILTGQNFTAESKVVFTEKTTGQGPWELSCVHWCMIETTLVLVPASPILGWIPLCGVSRSALFPHRDKFPRSAVTLMSTQSLPRPPNVSQCVLY